MKRSCRLALALLLTLGAGPPRDLPIPPIPPPVPPAGQTAPIPDRDAQAPPDENSNGTRVGVQDFRVERFNDSPGYTPGSQFRTSEDKRPIQTPGLSVHVPLR